MKSYKTGVLLINLGTPDSPKVNDVRSYLFQFLNDPRVIDIPWILRAILVNLIIVPFRAPKSAKTYQELWTPAGSPLMIHTQNVARKLQASLGDGFHVEFAMRYKNPSLDSILKKMRKMNFDKLILVPLFPQYASSSTGSALQRAMEIISKWYVIPEISVVSQYYDHERYLEAFAARGREHDLNAYDHIIFSYHGVPERQVDKVYEDSLCADHHCELAVDDENKFCYKAVCFETTRQIAKKLGLSEKQYTTAFQSRLGRDPWLEPATENVIIDLAKKGVKKLLVFSPAFTADCLETIIEIGEEYKEVFEEYGGKHLQLVESLNDHPLWIETLKELVLKRSPEHAEKVGA